VNKRRSATPLMINGSEAWGADRDRDPAPINMLEPQAAVQVGDMLPQSAAVRATSFSARFETSCAMKT
jgi:hypothetical protein